MVECRRRARFSLKAPKTLGVERDGVRQHLDRDVAPQARVTRTIDFAHPAGTESRANLIRPKPHTGTDFHGRRQAYVYFLALIDVNPRLLALKNVVLTPRIGSATLETRGAMAQIAATDVRRFLHGEKPLNAVT
jgi:hypothetical protein